MTRRFGTLRRLPSGRWQASYTGPDRRRHSAPSTFDDRADGELWLARVRRRIELDGWQPPEDRRQQAAVPTVGEYVRTVIDRRATRSRRPLRPSTVDLYRRLVRLTMGALEHVRLDSLTPAMVADWYANLDPDAPTQRGNAYELLRSVLADAVEDGLIAANPAHLRGAGKPARARQVEALTVDEMVAYLAAADPRYRPMLALAGWCGLRSGEVRALRRRDLDLERGEVHIRQNVTKTYRDGRRQWIIGPPKTAAGRRTVAIPPAVIPMLKQWARGRLGAPDDLLFPAAGGEPMDGSALRAAHKRAAGAIGRGSLTVHDLRRTAATLAAEGGATTAELMRLLGHTTVGVAMLYQVPEHARDRARAEALSRRIEQAGG